MIVSFNNHWPNHVDHNWSGPMPINPDRCLKSVFKWLKGLELSKDEIHSIVLPGVREGLVVTAYHALMGHFPTVYYSMRNNQGRYVWREQKLQTWREEMRTKR